MSETDLAFECLSEFVNWYLANDHVALNLNKGSVKFLSLPFDTWLRCDSSAIDADLLEWKRMGYKPSRDMKISVGSLYMPPSLLKRLLGPSLPDITQHPVSFQRSDCRWGEEYAFSKEQRCQDKDWNRRALKGAIACSLQWYLFKYICDGKEITSCFYHPASVKELSLRHQLAIGVMREVLILPHFGSMQNFWMAHAKLLEEGGKELGNTTTFEVLEGHEMAASMLQILKPLGICLKSADTLISEANHSYFWGACIKTIGRHASYYSG